MTRTFPNIGTIDRHPTTRPAPSGAVDHSFSKAFDAILDALFARLEPAVDRSVSDRFSESCALSRQQTYAGFEAPAYRRHGRLIPELERSNL
jgi:hypothetical protein